MYAGDHVTSDPQHVPNRSAALRRLVRAALAVGVGVAVLLVLRLTASLTDTNAALETMGFDPQRARLITDLSVVAMIVAISSFTTGFALAAALTGLAIGGALYGRSFIDQTRAAMTASGAQGSFDPGGWLVTAAALAVALAIVAWAAAALALIVRRAVLAAWSDGLAVIRGERPRRRAIRPIATLLAIVLVVATVPVFGDMVNYAPDVHMRSGRGGLVGLAQPGGGAPTIPGPSLPAAVLSVPTLLPAASAGPAHPDLLSGRPWTAWQPTGTGTVDSIQLAAPWTGGSASHVTLDVYLPPGYAAGTRAYPVVYELTAPLAGPWTAAIHITDVLDTLIDSAAMPASIVAFVGMGGGPFPSSECVDSLDHRQWLDTYLARTVVSYVDGQYRTIAKPAARSLLGFSQGGYCAPMLAMRHPNLFGTAMAISGYFEAGIRSSETPNAWRPFGGDAQSEAAHSPLRLAAGLPAPARASLFFEVAARPGEAFFGPQYAAFAAVLHDAGIAVALFPSALGHSWQEVRSELPSMLEVLGQRENALGVFR